MSSSWKPLKVCELINDDNLPVDTESLKIFPGDVPVPHCFPVKVRTNVNCLPGCGSVFAFGKDDHPAQIRVRIVHELVLHDD